MYTQATTARCTHTVICGDMHRIRIGARCSLQDNSVLHITTPALRSGWISIDDWRRCHRRLPSRECRTAAPSAAVLIGIRRHRDGWRSH